MWVAGTSRELPNLLSCSWTHPVVDTSKAKVSPKNYPDSTQQPDTKNKTRGTTWDPNFFQLHPFAPLQCKITKRRKLFARKRKKNLSFLPNDSQDFFHLGWNLETSVPETFSQDGVDAVKSLVKFQTIGTDGKLWGMRRFWKCPETSKQVNTCS